MHAAWQHQHHHHHFRKNNVISTLDFETGIPFKVLSRSVSLTGLQDIGKHESKLGLGLFLAEFVLRQLTDP